MDSHQLLIIDKLQNVLDSLYKKESSNFFKEIITYPFKKFFENRSVQKVHEDSRKTNDEEIKQKHKFRGLYLWGSVGAGKTYLMDLFYENLPIKRKLRLHFHDFMKKVHDKLALLQGKPDPLSIIARHFSIQAKIICFDEFVVNDIADAMLLGRLLKFLFERNVILITTSNRPPDDLYWEGLQREQFLPAIDLLKTHCDVVELSSKQDYRWRSLQQAGIYFTPLNDDAQRNMQKVFDSYADGSGQQAMSIMIEERPIMTLFIAKSVVWFDFLVLCRPPRSQMDYLAIARQFPVVLISNLTQIHPDDEMTISYWIELVDIFYDNKTLLILSSSVSLKDIYPRGKKQFEFERTLSRLIEMQSLEYHNPRSVTSDQHSQQRSAISQ